MPEGYDSVFICQQAGEKRAWQLSTFISRHNITVSLLKAGSKIQENVCSSQNLRCQYAPLRHFPNKKSLQTIYKGPDRCLAFIHER